MADDREILLRVELDKSQAQVGLESVTTQILENKQAVNELNTAYKQGTISTQAYVKETIRLKSEQKTLTDQEKQLTKEINAEANSIDALRAKLSALTKERNAVNQKTKEGAARFNELQKEIKQTTEKLKEQEQAGGDFRRNVGNYKEAFTDAAGGINVFGTSLGSVFKMILTNPIGLAVAAATALLKVLSGYEEVFDFFERGLDALAAGFESALGGGTLSDMAAAAQEAYNLAAAMQDLEDKERAMSVESAKSEAAVKNLLIQAKDRTKTDKERLLLLERASQIESKNFQMSLILAKEEARIAQAKLAMSEKNGRADDEIRDKAAQAQIKLIKLQSESADIQEKITNRQNALLQEIQADKDKEVEKETERLKKIEEANKKAFEERQKLREKEKQAQQRLLEFRLEQDIKEIESAEGKLQKQVELETARRDFLLNNEKLTKSERLLIEEQFEAKKLELYQKTADEQIKLDEKRKQSQADLDQFFLEQNVKHADSIEEKVNAEIELETFKRDQLLENDQLLAEERALINEKYNAQVVDINRKAEQAKRAEADKTAKLDRELLDQKLSLATGLFGALSSLAAQGSEEQKALATTAAFINTAQGVSGALANSAPPPIGLGPIGSIIAATTIGLKGVAEISKINAAAGGGDFVTTKPTLLLVGDNPGGRERVTVEPLSGKGKTQIFPNSGMIAMAGGGTLTTGAMMARSMTSQIDNEFSQTNGIINAFTKLPSPVVSVKEITRKSDRVTVKESVKNL